MFNVMHCYIPNECYDFKCYYTNIDIFTNLYRLIMYVKHIKCLMNYQHWSFYLSKPPWRTYTTLRIHVGACKQANSTRRRHRQYRRRRRRHAATEGLLILSAAYKKPATVYLKIGRLSIRYVLLCRFRSRDITTNYATINLHQLTHFILSWIIFWESAQS